MLARVLKLSTISSVIVMFIIMTTGAAFGWETNQKAVAKCNPDGPGVVVEGEFTNVEPANRSDLDMKVSANLHGQPMQIVGSDIAKSGGGAVKAKYVLGDASNVLPGQVTFVLKWADGHPGTDSRTASFAGVSGCEDVPGVSMTVNPTVDCGVKSFPVTISAGAGSTSVTPVLKADGVAISVPPIQPNTSATVNVPITDGQVVHLQLLQNGKVVDEKNVTATSINECAHPTAAVSQSNECGVFQQGMIAVTRNGMTGDFKAVLGNSEWVITGDSVVVTGVTSLQGVKVFDSLNREVPVTFQTSSDNSNCPKTPEPPDTDHEDNPPPAAPPAAPKDACPNTPEFDSTVPSDMQIDATGQCVAKPNELPFTGAFTIILIAIASAVILGGGSILIIDRVKNGQAMRGAL